MKKAGDIITALFRDSFGPEFLQAARSNVELFSSWQKIVSEVWRRSPVAKREDFADAEQEDVPAAASHSRIKGLEKGVLFVETDHPGWIQILQTKQSELLSVVQHRYPDLKIRAIAFRLNR